MSSRTMGQVYCSDKRVQSLESQVNLCMYGVMVLPKVVDFYFDRI